VLTIFGAATHSGTLVLLIGLTAAAALVRLVALARFPLERIWRAVAALAFSAIFVLTLNGSVTGTLGWAPGGYALSFGRMLQDGIVHKYLDRHCPDATFSGAAAYSTRSAASRGYTRRCAGSRSQASPNIRGSNSARSSARRRSNSSWSIPAPAW
jgi:hypothetical protein